VKIFIAKVIYCSVYVIFQNVLLEYVFAFYYVVSWKYIMIVL